MQKKARNIFLFIFILGVAIWGGVVTVPRIENLRVVPLLSPSPTIVVPSGSPQAASAPNQSAQAPQSVRSLPGHPKTSSFASKNQVRNRESLLQSWERFTERFGTHLIPEFSKDGYLVSVKGKVGEGVPSNTPFDSSDPRKAIARAREVIQAVDELIGFQKDWPLENAAARSGARSAQVFFTQTHDGISVGPSGNVKVDLGPQGELLGLDSDYAAEISIANAIVLDSEQAKQKVPMVFRKQENSMIVSDVDGGGKVLWVSGREARFAYQFSVNGQQVVIDAASGNVLYSKNRRHYFRS